MLQSIVPKGVHLKEVPEEIVDSLHGTEGSRINRKKFNRGRGREKRRPAGDLRWPSQATARRVRGHEPFQPGPDRRPGADPRGYRGGGEGPAQQPNGLRCRLARRIRRANGPLTLSLEFEVRTGHLRCVISLRERNLEEWLTPDGVGRLRLDSILSEKGTCTTNIRSLRSTSKSFNRVRVLILVPE